MKTESKTPRIVVSGATGTIGSTLIHLLSQCGAQVIALSRKPPQNPFLQGIQWVQADLAKPTTLPPAFANAEALFLLTGNLPEMISLQRNAIAAAKNSGVKRVVKLSALGASLTADSLIGLRHALVEEELDRSGMEWTSLQPHAFMQNFISQANSIRQGIIASSVVDGKIPFIDTRDIAAVAAKILLHGGYSAQKLTLTGPRALTYRDVAQIFSEKLGYPIQYLPKTEEEVWAQLRSFGLPLGLTTSLMAFNAAWQEGKIPYEPTDNIRKVTAKAPKTLENFIDDYLEVWKK